MHNNRQTDGACHFAQQLHLDHKNGPDNVGGEQHEHSTGALPPLSHCHPQIPWAHATRRCLSSQLNKTHSRLVSQIACDHAVSYSRSIIHGTLSTTRNNLKHHHNNHQLVVTVAQQPPVNKSTSKAGEPRSQHFTHENALAAVACSAASIEESREFAAQPSCGSQKQTQLTPRPPPHTHTRRVSIAQPATLHATTNITTTIVPSSPMCNKCITSTDDNYTQNHQRNAASTSEPSHSALYTHALLPPPPQQHCYE